MDQKQSVTARDACQKLLSAIESSDEKQALKSSIGLLAGTLELLERIAKALENIEAKLNG
jgi:hypothetical protein